MEAVTCFALFDTALGWAGLAWNDAGLAAVCLPQSKAEWVVDRLRRCDPWAVEAGLPPALQPLVADIRRLLDGQPADLRDAVLDLSTTPDFDARVYAIARAIPPGQTLTYGEIAERLGDKLLAREVGAALGRNPWPIVVPCHRVTAANGKLGGFSAPGGSQTKLRLLAIEGAAAAAQGDLFA